MSNGLIILTSLFLLIGLRFLRIFKTLTSHKNLQESNLAVAGRAVTMAGDVVTTMLSKGYNLSKDSLVKAKELDDKYQVTATSAAKVTAMGKDAMTKAKELGPVAAVKMVALGKDALNSAGSKVANSCYVRAGAMWVSETFERGSKAAYERATKGNPLSK